MNTHDETFLPDDRRMESTHAHAPEPQPQRQHEEYQGQPVFTGASNPYAPPQSQGGSSMPGYSHSQSHDLMIGKKDSPLDESNEPLTTTEKKEVFRLDAKWKKRAVWMIPLGALVIVIGVLFEVYKSDFERWVKPLADWLDAREAWSWVIPVAILVILSFPPLFGHEIVQIVVGLAYPLGIAMGIACAGAIIGEAACFLVFKYGFTGYVQKKIDTKIRWAAVARVSQQAGFRGVLVIRYSIIPPHLANPLFACTGMAFWVYMVTVILSLPKTIVFVALGTSSSEQSKGVKYGKAAAIAVVVIVSIFASGWIRRKMAIATAEIEEERGALGRQGEDFEMIPGDEDTAYRGANGTSYGGANGYKRPDNSERV